MTKKSYFMIGKCEYNNHTIYTGGNINLNEMLTDDIIYIEGRIGDSRTNTSKEVKGFLKNDMNLEKTITLIALEFPIKKGAANKVYMFERDLSEITNPNSTHIEGDYEGIMFTGVKIRPMKKIDIESLEIPHAEIYALLSGMDFEYENEKEFKTNMEIQKYDDVENPAA